MAVRAGGAVDPASRIERLMTFQEKRFQATWLEAIRLIKNSWTLDDLADLLERGLFEEALASLEEAALLIGNRYGEALAASARDTAAFLSEALTVTVSFDQTNARAVEIMRRNRLRLIREVTADQVATMRQAMTHGITQGLNPRDQARLFRDSIGLTARQEASVARYRQLLEGEGIDRLPSSQVLNRRLRDGRFDRTVRRALREGEPLTERQIETMVGRYRDRYIKYRAEVIGRTEALRSVHEGTEEMYQQAIDQGAVDPGALVRTWNSARDGRTRDSHASLNGVEKPIGEPWEGQDGLLRYPGDPDAPGSETIQCRCVLSTVLSDN